MSAHIRFNQGDEDSPNSSSDEEYDENEKILLKKFRNSNRTQDSESETEVLAVGPEDESEDDTDIALSDIEGQEQEDDEPDNLNWGKNKKNYYGGDDLDNLDDEEDDMVQSEVKRLKAETEKIQGASALDLVLLKGDSEAIKANEKSKRKIADVDFTTLSDKEKSKILKNEIPEFFNLTKDFKDYMTIAKADLQPILEKVKNKILEKCKAVEFVDTMYQLILNYCTNIYMYLLVLGHNQLTNHPINQRLYQYKYLLSQMQPVYEEVLKPQIEELISEPAESHKNIAIAKSKKSKVLKLLTQLKEDKNGIKKKAKLDIGQQSKRIKLDKNIEGKSGTKKVTFNLEETKSDDEESGVEMDNHEEQTENSNKEIDQAEPDGNAKRAITYQIAKNKGLTPYRKKELRNPRVKHRIKFKKALIRRKGAVREPRKEVTRYSGEISGIKASVSKSIKIKS